MKNKKVLSIILLAIPVLIIAAGMIAGFYLNTKAEEATVNPSPKREDYGTLAEVVPFSCVIAAGCIGLPLSLVVKKRTNTKRSNWIRIAATIEFVFGIVCAAIFVLLIIPILLGVFPNIISRLYNSF